MLEWLDALENGGKMKVVPEYEQVDGDDAALPGRMRLVRVRVNDRSVPPSRSRKADDR